MEIFVQVLPPSVENSQFKIFPEYPLNVTVPLFELLQTLALPETVPPTDGESKEIVAEEEFACEQTPLFTAARYNLVGGVRLEYDWEFVVLTIFAQLLPPSIEYSQFKIFPVCPLRVNVPLLLPLHTVALPEIVPPTDEGSIVIVAKEELFCGHTPLCTTAR